MEQVARVKALDVSGVASERDFGDLLKPMIEPAFRLAFAMLHDPHAAEDAVQEASFTAWRKVAKIDDLSRLRPWFLGVVANKCRNARRGKWRAGVTLGLGEELSVVSDEERSLQGADLRRAIGRLKHEDRLVVVLFFYLDMPLDEVAAVAGTSVAATRARLYRSVRRLRPDVAVQEALK
jgi:RNA polymerase sigma-70 factor (ECF subfamily)